MKNPILKMQWLGALSVAALAMTGCGGGGGLSNSNARARTFTVRVENLSTPTTLNTSQGAKPVPLSPGAWAVQTAPNVMFTPGARASAGIERIAEDGFPMTKANELQNASGVRSSGTFSNEGGALGPALEPGSAATFTVTAFPGDRLSIATMFVQSNDLFYAPDGNGIALFGADGNASVQDLTSQLILWDAGTERNQEPGAGTDQKPDQGPDETNIGPPDPLSNVIRNIGDVNDTYTYPATSQVIRLTITPQ